MSQLVVNSAGKMKAQVAHTFSHPIERGTERIKPKTKNHRHDWEFDTNTRKHFQKTPARDQTPPDQVIFPSTKRIIIIETHLPQENLNISRKFHSP